MMDSSRRIDRNRIGSVEFPQNPSPIPPTVYSELKPGFTAVAAPDAKFIVRKKNRPLHRCRSTNSLVTGIIKPSRYSQGGDQLNMSMHTYLIYPPRRSSADDGMNASMQSNLIKFSTRHSTTEKSYSSVQSELIKSSQNCQGGFQSSLPLYDSVMHFIFALKFGDFGSLDSQRSRI